MTLFNIICFVSSLFVNSCSFIQEDLFMVTLFDEDGTIQDTFVSSKVLTDSNGNVVGFNVVDKSKEEQYIIFDEDVAFEVEEISSK